MRQIVQLVLLALVVCVQSANVTDAAACTSPFITNGGFEKKTKQGHLVAWNANDAVSEDPAAYQIPSYGASGKYGLNFANFNNKGIAWAEQLLNCMNPAKTYRIQMKIGHTHCQGYTPSGGSYVPCIPPIFYIYLDGNLIRAGSVCGPKSIQCQDGFPSAHYWTLQINGIKPATARPLLRLEMEFPQQPGIYYYGLIDDVMVFQL